MISNNTSLIGLFKGSADDLYNQFVRITPYKVNLDKVGRLSAHYIKWCKMFTLRADIAWSQMEHETAFLTYPRQVKEYSNNFAGLGAIEGTGKFAVFKTEELGVIAHIAHLAWYVYATHKNSYCSIKYDPRHNVFGDRHNYNGNSTLGTLNTRWAPSKTYTAKIIDFANKIFVSDSLITPIESISQKVKDSLNISTNYRWSYIAIHHTVSSQKDTTMEQIKRWHLARGFLREGYNYGINGDGLVEVGRPLDMAGAHVKNWNTKAIGIALYGDFRTDKLTNAQKESAFLLISTIKRIYDIPVSNVLGHREFGAKTLCPVIDMDLFRCELENYLQGNTIPPMCKMLGSVKEVK